MWIPLEAPKVSVLWTMSSTPQQNGPFRGKVLKETLSDSWGCGYQRRKSHQSFSILGKKMTTFTPNEVFMHPGNGSMWKWKSCLQKVATWEPSDELGNVSKCVGGPGSMVVTSPISVNSTTKCWQAARATECRLLQLGDGEITRVIGHFGGEWCLEREMLTLVN